MAISKKVRQAIYQQFNGLCAYTGTPLKEDWQIDHVTSRYEYRYKEFHETGETDVVKIRKKADNIGNLFPTQRIINHYKRELNLDMFRKYMLTFHLRLKKLPKNTGVSRTQRRKEYLFVIAELFGITPEKPFNGIFYFEKHNMLIQQTVPITLQHCKDRVAKRRGFNWVIFEGLRRDVEMSILNDASELYARYSRFVAREQLRQEQKAECEHPYHSVYRKMDYEKCNKCGKVLCEG